MKVLKPLKPYKFRRWRLGLYPDCYHFFTCARPGRTGNPVSKNAHVTDNVVHRWVLGLPGPKTAIVSLLGRKPDGLSEFSFYSFTGGFDRQSAEARRLSFREWLNEHYKERVILCEHPTDDYQSIDHEKLAAIGADIRKLISEGHTVVVVDSGGQQRTEQVRRHLDATEDSARKP